MDAGFAIKPCSNKKLEHAACVSLNAARSKDSSEIENIVTTTGKLFMQAQLLEENAGPATKEALRRRARTAPSRWRPSAASHEKMGCSYA